VHVHVIGNAGPITSQELQAIVGHHPLLPARTSSGVQKRCSTTAAGAGGSKVG
jgi:hypothetical protein